jgi:uncharacterized membrane protein YeaQ/YmgE (transglycosylase-associated protein family)
VAQRYRFALFRRQKAVRTVKLWPGLRAVAGTKGKLDGCSVHQSDERYWEHIAFAGGAKMLHWIWAAIIGLLVGGLAKLIMPGRDPGGIFITMALGIAGSLIAGYLGRALGLYREGQGAGFIMSLIGSLILLGIYRLFKNRAATT